MALYTFLRNNPSCTGHDIEEAMDGNLCRCTGYRPILDAAKSFATDAGAPGCCGGAGRDGGCCMDKPAVDEHESPKSGAADALGRPLFRVVTDTLSKHAAPPCTATWSGDWEPIFPPFLKAHHVPRPLAIVGARVTWLRPVSLAGLLAVLAAHPGAKMVAGNTEVGIETKFKNCTYPVRVGMTHVAELRPVVVLPPASTPSGSILPGVPLSADAHDADVLPDGVRARGDLLTATHAHGALVVGGAATLTAFKAACDDVVGSQPAHASRVAATASRMLRWFASNQIRGVATLAGNIATASPISDMNPVLVAAGAYLVVVRHDAAPRLVTLRKFFKSYRVTELQAGDVIAAVVVPFASPFQFVHCYTQKRRREDDIALVGAAFSVRLEPVSGRWQVADAGAGFAGMAAITRQATDVTDWLVGRPWDRDTLTAALDRLRAAVALPADVPGGMPEFRQAVALSFLFKFFVMSVVELQDEVAAAGPAAGLPPPPALADDDRSALPPPPRPPSYGIQTYDLPLGPGGDVGAAEEGTGPDAGGAVGKPVLHSSALKQVSGEAVYADDIPPPMGCLEAALILSTIPHGTFTLANVEEVAARPGVVRVITAADVVGVNAFGVAPPYDEEVLAVDTVHHVGQVLGVVVAATRDGAEAAAKAVKVEYEALPSMHTIREAIEAGSFFPSYDRSIVVGDADGVLASPEVVVVEGEARCGGQEHFYLEPNACLAVPGEGNESMLIQSSTQANAKTQSVVAGVLGIPMHRVVSKTKRIGGGFGGKETRTVPIAAAVAIAAKATNRPVRIAIDRDVDMQITGERHAFYCKYKVGVKPDGTIVAWVLDLFNNGGWSQDLTPAVMDRALWSCCNAYSVGATRVRGRLCRTNNASHTAFRGFGGPQGMYMAEVIMCHVARRLGRAVEDIRGHNLVRAGERTPYGSLIERSPLRSMWEEFHATTQFTARRAAVDKFNAASRHRKRGIAMVPTQYGIAFGQKFLNQGGALVMIYTDGSVLITHGGVEIGQGLYTKMVQIAAHVLGVPVDMVHIEESSTDKVPNASPTAASASTDIYGGAVKDACEKLAARLKPYVEANPSDWKAAVRSAYFDRVNLSGQGFYAMERVGYDWDMVTDDNSKRGAGPFQYFTNGMCCVEVDVDVLTGDHTVRRVDILMDLGNSVNAAADVGQVEGAFVQGQGWATTEELVWGDEDHKWVRPGQLYTKGPGTYKIPAFNDVPLDFRVSLLHNTPNPHAVFSSKAVGEPPLFLGSTTLFALQNAVASARADNGVGDVPFSLQLPATCERIRMACADSLTSRVMESHASFTPKASI